VKDKNGVDVDVVLGYDNASYYPVDPGHPVYNAIPGRYSNRIGNGTFSINGTKYFTEKNDGPNTLHSGTNNWSFRFWNVSGLTNNSITFSLHDPSLAEQGLVGRVLSSVTYRLTPKTWHITIDAESLDNPTRKTTRFIAIKPATNSKCLNSNYADPAYLLQPGPLRQPSH
jgi:aldose 1-epimerase